MNLFRSEHIFLHDLLSEISPKIDYMSIESIPKSAVAAAELWVAIPTETKK